MYTLTALRRRGFPPEAINLFCGRIGVTMSQTVLHPDMLDACVREVLNATAPRYDRNINDEVFIHVSVPMIETCLECSSFSRVMVVLEPLKVTITNFPSNQPMTLTVPRFPNDESRGSHTVKFDSVIYIEKSDFCEVGMKN